MPPRITPDLSDCLGLILVDTSIPTSTERGWRYLAVALDLSSRKVVGWKVSSTAHTDLVLDALEQALRARRPTEGGL